MSKIIIFLKTFAIPSTILFYFLLTVGICLLVDKVTPLDFFLLFLVVSLVGTLVCGALFLISCLISVLMEYNDNEKETLKFVDHVIAYGVIKSEVLRDGSIEYTTKSGLKREFASNSIYWDMICNNKSKLVFWFWVINRNKIKKAAENVEAFMVMDDLT